MSEAAFGRSARRRSIRDRPYGRRDRRSRPSRCACRPSTPTPTSTPAAASTPRTSPRRWTGPRPSGVTRVVTVADDLAARPLGGAGRALGRPGRRRGRPAPHAHGRRSPTTTTPRSSGWPRDPRVVAVGETGLDYYWDYSPPAAQQEAFRWHIDLAKRLGKPLMIHDRDAHDDVLRILDEEGAPDTVVFHCFSGDAAMARTCVDAGYVLSFAGPGDVPQRRARCARRRPLVPDGAAARRDRRAVPHPAPAPRPGERAVLPAVDGARAGTRCAGSRPSGSPRAPRGPPSGCSGSVSCRRSRTRRRRAPGARARRSAAAVRRSRRVAVRRRLSPPVTVL